MKIDVFTLFPSWFGVVRRAASRAQRARRSATRSTFVDLRATTPLQAGQVDDTPYGGGAGMVIRADVVEAALSARYDVDPLELPARRRVIALAAGGRRFDDSLADGARRRAGADAALRPLRGLRRARARAPGERRRVDRALRPVGRRAGGDGRLRRGDPQASRARSATRTARSRSPSARRSRARPSTRTTRARRTGADTQVPDVLLSGDHAPDQALAPRAEPPARRRRLNQPPRRPGVASLPCGRARSLPGSSRLSCAPGPARGPPHSLCQASSTASSALSCAASLPSRPATACGCTSRWSRARAAAPRSSRAS